ncbi:hypothetical protein PENTCL1PPCAC_22459, partial [Pristionchus entomophagus]
RELTSRMVRRTYVIYPPQTIYKEWKARGDTESLMAIEGGLSGWASEEDDLCEACCCRDDGKGEPVCCCCAPCSETGLTFTRLLLSRPGRLCLLFTFMLLLYLFYLGVSWSVEVQAFGEESTAIRTGINTTRAKEVLSSLCDAYNRNEVSGDACHRLCFNQEWTVADFYEGNKVVVVIKDGGQQAVFKSLHPYIQDYDSPPKGEKEEDFARRIRDKTDDELMLGWPTDLIDHLLSILWPSHLRSGGQQLSQADRRSLWALMQQPEYLTFRILPLSRVTPKVIGSCGHMYEVESLVAFRMKGYYMNLKGKILVHLMGTLKLFYEFLNEPLQWCDVRFDNLGLSAEYPKRFVMMDGDLLFTESKLKALMTAKSCKNDADCAIGDCTSRCQADFKCGPRNNENLDVFCEKLINKLFGNAWSKSNKYLNACHDTVTNTTTKLNDLRLTWSWTLSDV